MQDSWRSRMPMPRLATVGPTVARAPRGNSSHEGAKGAATPMQTPARVLDVELSEPLTDVEPWGSALRPDGRPYGAALVLVRLHGQPLGTLDLDLRTGAVEAGRLAELAWDKLRGPLLEHLARDGMWAVDGLTAAGLASDGPPPCQRFDDHAFPFVSVVISTHERPGPVAGCIQSILEADYPHFEVLVVDNAPRTAATRAMVAERFGDDPRVTYLLEPTPGASAGRNCGLRVATGEVVVFVD